MAKLRDDMNTVDISVFLPELASKFNKRDRRVFLAGFSDALGYGGIRTVSRITGVAETTIQRGIRELSDPSYFEEDRKRAPGGGRKRAEELHPDLKNWIMEIAAREVDARQVEGKRKSPGLRKISKALEEEHHVSVSCVTVGRILAEIKAETGQ